METVGDIAAGSHTALDQWLTVQVVLAVVAVSSTAAAGGAGSGVAAD